MRWSRTRTLAVGGLAAGAAGLVVAVASALGTARDPVTGGVAAAHATKLASVTRTVQVAGVRVATTTKPSGAVCFRAPHVSSCASGLADGQLAYDTGTLGRRVVLAGVAGPDVKGVIARLTRRGTVWPRLEHGAFYAVLPDGYRLRAIVKVLAGGTRVAFKA